MFKPSMLHLFRKLFSQAQRKNPADFRQGPPGSIHPDVEGLLNGGHRFL